MLTPNQPVQTFNVAETLKNEEGRYLVQRAGQTFLVTAQKGHSITSWRAVGTVEPTAISPGSNSPFTVTLIDETGMENEYDQQPKRHQN